MTTLQIRLRIEEILEFLQPHWDFVNCHMVEFLTDHHWQRYVPKELRDEVANVEQVKQCIEEVFWSNAEVNTFPEFSKFTTLCRQHRLSNFPDILNPATELLNKSTLKQRSRLSIVEHMSAKKKHEVEIMAELIDALLEDRLVDDANKQIFIVDAGDGKGYLSSLLALQYGHKVLGIDANEMNTKNAQERNIKLQRAWNGLKSRAELRNDGIIPPRRGKMRKFYTDDTARAATEQCEKYKTTSKFIDSDLDVVQLLVELFPASNLTLNNPLTPFICLSGLHTCGNLGATCLQLFHAQPNLKIVCNIGCCYHLLTESFSGQEFFGEKNINKGMETEAGFPMSQYLTKKCIRLGRNARMLAAQSIERTFTSKELPNISLYYRALLEVVLCEHNKKLKGTIQVGKIRKFETFEQYMALCESKLSLGINNLSNELIERIQLQHAADESYLNLFYILRMMFAPILESLILLDRVLYLKELGYAQSYLLPLFDPVISPRHFAIVSLKD